MTALRAATMLFLMGASVVATPVAAQVVIDLPTLTWPDTTPNPSEPVSQGCADPTRPGSPVDCE